MKNPQSIPDKVIDPVCGMTVAPEPTAEMTTFNGKRYYFCAEGCLRAFEKNPCRYLTGRPPKRKSWWGRYLDRLNKATKGKPMQCH